MNDQRLDQLLKTALALRAERVAARQPRMRVATTRLANRLGPTARGVQPRMIGVPVMSGLNLLLILVALALLVAGALFVGSQLLRDPLPRPGPLGFHSDCEVTLGSGVLIEARPNGRALWLLANGALVTDESVEGSDYEENVLGSAYAEWRLSARGVDLILDRVGQAAIDEGCRHLRTREAVGRLDIATDESSSSVTWGPAAGDARVQPLLTEAAELSLVDLMAALEQPETWLPEDAFAEAVPRRYSAESWLVTFGFIPTDLPPGARVVLGGGLSLDGTDPRYGDVELPGAAAPLEFGAPGPTGLVGPGTEMRCGVVDRSAVLALAQSLDAHDLYDQSNPLHTPDLAYEIQAGIEPAFPEGFDCAASFAKISSAEATPPPPVVGDLSDVDPCSLLNSNTAEATLDADSLATERSALALGVPALACAVYAARDDPGLPPSVATSLGRKATVTLYPRRLNYEQASLIAQTAFGAGTVESRLTGQPVWENDCIAAELECTRAIAAWSGQRLIVFEFPRSSRLPDRPHTPPDVARTFVEQTLEELPG